VGSCQFFAQLLGKSFAFALAWFLQLQEAGQLFGMLFARSSFSIPFLHRLYTCVRETNRQQILVTLSSRLTHAV
jgi:hypothetical protein